MCKKSFILIILFNLLITSPALSEENNFTQEDRQRLRALEISLSRLDEGLKSTNNRIDALAGTLNTRIDDLKAELKADNKELMEFFKSEHRALRAEISALRDLVYVMISGIFILIGFVLWDRRSTLAPVVRKNRELEDRENVVEEKAVRLEMAFKDLAGRNPDAAAALKSAGLV